VTVVVGEDGHGGTTLNWWGEFERKEEEDRDYGGATHVQRNRVNALFVPVQSNVYSTLRLSTLAHLPQPAPSISHHCQILH
jgi:hypothetical protein